MHCYFCGRRVTVVDGWLEFYAVRKDGALRYPASDGRVIAVSTHTACGPDTGYALALSRCVDVASKWGLLDHIRQKLWYSAECFAALVRAEAFVKREAVRLAGRPKRETSTDY